MHRRLSGTRHAGNEPDRACAEQFLTKRGFEQAARSVRSVVIVFLVEFAMQVVVDPSHQPLYRRCKICLIHLALLRFIARKTLLDPYLNACLQACGPG